jgi:two-component system response regulator HydG
MSHDRTDFVRRRPPSFSGPTANPPASVTDTPGDPLCRSESEVMRQFWALAARVAPGESTVLVIGETGVGKELVAHWLHDASPRAHRPFEPVHCGAIADTLLESTLFGHARGAFTGAVRDHVGWFEGAQGGTLFLDEIGEMSLPTQMKLLRVIQERELRRVGESKARRIDIRILAATNRNLEAEVREGRFREDLYFRLSVIKLEVPPLRDRLEDLPGLARDFLARATSRGRQAIDGLTPQAMDCLLGHRWPGNVRELLNAMEYACTIATGPCIDVDDLPQAVRASCAGGGEDVKSFRQAGVDHMMTVLRRNRGNQRRTALQLGISVATLRRHMRTAGERRTLNRRT